MNQAWEVEFFPDQIRADLETGLTPKQIAQLFRNLKRLEEHGPNLGSNYFAPVRGSKQGIKEFRVSVQDCDLRFLYHLDGSTYVMLHCFKKGSGKRLRQQVRTAERRWLARKGAQ